MLSTINKRVLKDIQDGKKNLKDEFGIHIAPEEDNYYRVHFLLAGPEDTPFEGGLYHGMIRLNDNHPKSPPNMYMFTPSGRFVPESCPEPKGSRGICTTATAFHPDTWTPMNNIETVLKGFVSLMCDPYDGGIGGMKSTNDQTKKFAKDSLECLKKDTYVKNLFPDLHKSLMEGTYQKVKIGELSKKPPIVTKTVEEENIITAKPKKSTDKPEATKSIKMKSKNKGSEPEDDIINVTDSKEKPKLSKKKPIVKKQLKKEDSDNSEPSMKKTKKSSKKVVHSESTDTENSEECDIKKPSKKKPIKKVVYSESSDSEDSDPKPSKKKPIKKPLKKSSRSQK